MNVDSDDECILSCNDSEEESDGSEGSIVNEYEGGECDNGVEGDIDDMDDLLLYTDATYFYCMTALVIMGLNCVCQQLMLVNVHYR